MQTQDASIKDNECSIFFINRTELNEATKQH